jgi:hypothetical protein
MLLAGAAYEMDRTTIYCDLKAYLIDTWVSLGLKLLMPQRIDVVLIWPGRHITMGKVSSASTLH